MFGPLFRSFLFLVLLLLLVRAIWRFLGGVVQGATSTGTVAGRQPASPVATKMARDPVCGTYVVPGKALPLAHGRETIFFCSEACRTKFASQPR